MKHLLILFVLSIFNINEINAQENSQDNSTQDFFITVSRPQDKTAISLKEWQNYMKMDATLMSTNTTSKISNSENNTLTYVTYKGDKKAIEFKEGIISSKNPTKGIIFKMFLISKRLNAEVKDSNGKIYTNDDFYKN